MRNNAQQQQTADMSDARSTYRSLACRQLLIAPHPLAPQPLRTAMHTCMGETDVSDALLDQIVLHPPVSPWTTEDSLDSRDLGESGSVTVLAAPPPLLLPFSTNKLS